MTLRRRSFTRGLVVVPVAITLGVLAAVLPSAGPAATASGAGYAVTRVPVGGMALGVAADPVTDTIYVGSASPDGIAVIDGSTDIVTATISLPFPPDVVVADPVTDTIYAIGMAYGTAVVINGATDTIVGSIVLPAGTRTIAAAVNPATHMLYVADYIHRQVIVINGSTQAVTDTIPVTDPIQAPQADARCVAVDTVTNQIYVSDGIDNQVIVIDGGTDKLTGRISLPAGAGPAGLVTDPAAARLYVADQGTGAVSVINTATNAVAAAITGLAQPFGLAIDPGTSTLYASSRAGTIPGGVENLGNTWVIDTTSQATTAQIPRGGPSIAVNTVAGGSAYITNGRVASPVAGFVEILTPAPTSTMSPVIVSGPVFYYTVGQPGQDQLLASATPAATFCATGLPAGLTLSPAGLLSGTPAAGTGGAYTSTVTATNGVAPPDVETVYLTVNQAPAIISANHATFIAGAAGSFTPNATGWPTPTFTESGVLPHGVVFSTSGALTGTPSSGTGGVYHIQLTAANSVGSPATQAFSLTVDQRPAFTSPARVTFTHGIRATFTIRTTGFPAANLTESGKLPGGMTFRAGASGTATISGTPWASAKGHTFAVTIFARNAAGLTASQKLTITVR